MVEEQPDLTSTDSSNIHGTPETNKLLLDKANLGLFRNEVLTEYKHARFNIKIHIRPESSIGFSLMFI